MPVLPLVASTIVAPAAILPARSASRIIESAGRSFTLPAGFMSSALAHTVAPPAGPTRPRRTRGVLAIRASASSATRRPFAVTRLASGPVDRGALLMGGGGYTAFSKDAPPPAGLRPARPEPARGLPRPPAGRPARRSEERREGK